MQTKSQPNSTDAPSVGGGGHMNGIRMDPEMGIKIGGEK